MADTFDRLKTALADRYRIERELGAGGMATVYLAEDLKLHRKVALKVLRPELAAALGPERFLREIKIAANLTHPHILPLHDSGEADGFLYYVMPYVDGESLRDRLNREQQLGLDDAPQIIGAVADAPSFPPVLDAVHRASTPSHLHRRGGPPVAPASRPPGSRWRHTAGISADRRRPNGARPFTGAAARSGGPRDGVHRISSSLSPASSAVIVPG